MCLLARWTSYQLMPGFVSSALRSPFIPYYFEVIFRQISSFINTHKCKIFKKKKKTLVLAKSFSQINEFLEKNEKYYLKKLVISCFPRAIEKSYISKMTSVIII